MQNSFRYVQVNVNINDDVALNAERGRGYISEDGPIFLDDNG